MSFENDLNKGVLWTSLNKYSSVIIQLLISSILARLITPQEFGIVAIAQVCITFLQIFAQLGIGPAIIQRKELEKSELNFIFSFTVYIGALLSLILFFLADPIAKFYNDRILVSIFRLLSLGLFFNAISVVPSYLFYREKQFKLLAQRNLAVQIVTGIFACFYAYIGGGCYAIVFFIIFSSFLSFCISYHYYPLKFIIGVDFTPLKTIATFSIFQFLFTLLNFFSRNLDKLIIGKFLTMTQLGVYQKSYQLMLQPLDKISDVVTPVMQPLFSDFQNNISVIASKYAKIVKLLSLISFPLSAILYFSSGDIIHIVYGKQWDAAIPCFRILVLSLPLQMIVTTTGAIYQSCNATKPMFYIGLLTSIFTSVGFFVSAFMYRTIESIAVTWNISIIFAFIVNFCYLYIIILKTRIKILFIGLFHPLLTFIILVGFYYFLPLDFIHSSFLSLIIKCIIGLLISLSYYTITKQINICTIVRKYRINK